MYIVQPTCPGRNQNVNTSIMELLLILHTVRLASCKRVTALVPYFAYGRQSFMTSPDTPIASAAVAKLMLSMQVVRSRP